MDQFLPPSSYVPGPSQPVLVEYICDREPAGQEKINPIQIETKVPITKSDLQVINKVKLSIV